MFILPEAHRLACTWSAQCTLQGFLVLAVIYIQLVTALLGANPADLMHWLGLPHGEGLNSSRRNRSLRSMISRGAGVGSATKGVVAAKQTSAQPLLFKPTVSADPPSGCFVPPMMSILNDDSKLDPNEPSTSQRGPVSPNVLSLHSPLSYIDTTPSVTTRNNPALTPEGTIRLNVGGRPCEVLAQELARLPDTRLGDLSTCSSNNELSALCDQFFEDTLECYFDRSPDIFDAILDLYRSGHVYLPLEFCSDRVAAELQYWRLSLDKIPSCCLAKLSDRVEQIFPKLRQTLPEEAGLIRAAQDIILAPFAAPHDEFRNIFLGSLRRKLWNFFEEPASSIYALIFMIFSMSFIVITVVALILGSIRDYQYFRNETGTWEVQKEIELTDTVCVGWFTFEYFVRLIITPLRWNYVKSPMSIIDLLAISPFYIELAFSIFGMSSTSMENFKRSFVLMRILRVLRVMRVLRVLKVARYSKGMQSMGSTIKRSWRELLMMVFFMVTSNIMFSTAVYFVENDEPDSKFYSIPAASWWCIITMTTVGYGDLTPTTVSGKVIASIASLTGIMLLAFPISVVVQNFDEEYYDNKEEEQPSPEDAKEMNGSVPGSRSPYVRMSSARQSIRPNSADAQAGSDIMWGGSKTDNKSRMPKPSLAI